MLGAFGSSRCVFKRPHAVGLMCAVAHVGHRQARTETSGKIGMMGSTGALLDTARALRENPGEGPRPGQLGHETRPV